MLRVYVTFMLCVGNHTKLKSLVHCLGQPFEHGKRVAFIIGTLQLRNHLLGCSRKFCQLLLSKPGGFSRSDQHFGNFCLFHELFVLSCLAFTNAKPSIENIESVFRFLL